MALTPENIAKINEFIADHAIMDLHGLARRHFPGRAKSEGVAQSIVSQFVASLRCIGVSIPRSKKLETIGSAELAEFRAWKARQNQDQNTPVA